MVQIVWIWISDWPDSSGLGFCLHCIVVVNSVGFSKFQWERHFTNNRSEEEEEEKKTF